MILRFQNFKIQHNNLIVEINIFNAAKYFGIYLIELKKRFINYFENFSSGIFCSTKLIDYIYN